MDFVHPSYQPDDTIAAIATPPGEGGVAMIRISGKDALTIAAKVFSGPVLSYKSHTAHYGSIRTQEGAHVDHALLLPMLHGNSYTGEDVVEVFCHGGALISRRVLDVILHAGARPARPGEFTFKAFLNGRLDLAQAEAVQSLISAKNEHAMHAADHQLQGKLSKKIQYFQERLTEVAAILEAWVDFPEEGLEFASMEEITGQLEEIKNSMVHLNATFRDGKILQDGISLCLVGSPNVGKSSLMNALLDKDRAIVSQIPGTTRDIVEDHVRINGLNIRLMDTAGIRDSDEVIEQEGIKRTKAAMKQADLILLVLEANRELNPYETDLLQQLPQEKTIIVWNKIDLLTAFVKKLDFPAVSISAKEGTGLEALREMIDAVIWKEGPPSREEVLITNVRHQEALTQAIESVQKVIEGLGTGVSPEFLTFDLTQGLKHLGGIIGTNISEDILSAIFSKFCVGK